MKKESLLEKNIDNSRFYPIEFSEKNEIFFYLIRRIDSELRELGYSENNRAEIIKEYTKKSSFIF